MQSQDIIIKELGFPGRLLAESKSAYRDRYPDDLIIFNANIAIPDIGKVWYGDIHITLEIEQLKRLSSKLQSPLYILYEFDYRFEKETLKLDEVLSKSLRYYRITEDGMETVIRNI